MSLKVDNIQNNRINDVFDINRTVCFKSNPIQKDRVEISTKKKEVQTNAKIGIGIGIAALMGLGAELIFGKGKHLKTIWEGVNKKKPVDEGKKYLEKIDEIQENFSKIFGRDYTKDEANELALKYKNIFETEDNNEFMKDFWLQINKDYNLPEIPYSLREAESDTLASFSLFGGVQYNTNNKIKWVIETEINNGAEKRTAKFITVDRLHLANCLAHELKHAKQKELACRADVQKTIEACVERVERNQEKTWLDGMRNSSNNIQGARNYCKTKFNNDMLPSYKNIEKLPKDSKEYQEGLRQIEGIRDYITPDKDRNGYWNQFVEVEARDAGSRMEQIYKWLMNK